MRSRPIEMRATVSLHNGRSGANLPGQRHGESDTEHRTTADGESRSE